MLAHCDYFTGGNREGLEHSAAEVARARRHDDTYRLAYVLADFAIHNVLAGDATLASQLADETMQLARELDCPSLLGIAHLAGSWCALETDPSTARQHAVTVFEYGEHLDAGWLLGTGAINLGMLTTEHGDPATDLPRVTRAADSYRRAGDDVRVRTMYCWCLPAVAQLVGTAQGEAIVALFHAISRRPVMTAESIARRLDRMLDDLHDHLGDERYQAAVERGHRTSDRELVDQATRLYDLAIATTRPP